MVTNSPPNKLFPNQRGFPTPDAPPEEMGRRVFLMPASEEYFALLMGAVTLLRQPYNWYQNGELTQAEAAELFGQIIDDAYDNFCVCETPDGQPIARLGELGTWEVLEGAWVPPSGAYAIPAYTARTEPTAAERKCLAAKNAANVLAQVYEQLSDDVSAHLTLAEIAFNVGVTIGLLIAPPLGALALAAVAIGVNSFKLITAIAEFITADVWDAQFTSNLTCALLANATDTAGVVTFNFDQLRSDLIMQTNWFDPTVLSQQLAAQVDNLLQNIGSEGLNLAGETTAITDSDCDDCLYWCRRETFLDSMWSWEIGSFGGADLAVYAPPFEARVNFELPGVGWGTFLVINKFMNLPGFCRWEIDYEWEQGTIGSGTPPGAQFIINGGVVAELFGDGSHTAVIDIRGYTVPGTVTVNFLLSLVGTPVANGSARVTEMRWYGQGIAPETIGVECDADPTKCDFE